MYESKPSKVEFYDEEFTIQKTWKISDKKDSDVTKDQFIKELESVNMFDVNQYRVDYLKTKVKSFVLENDLEKFNSIVQKLRKYFLFFKTKVFKNQVFKSSLISFEF